MRIIFFTHYFPPEVNAPAVRTHEHCRQWVKAGHDVHVVTCTPSHPLGQPFPGFGRPWYRHEEVDGIHVHRVWTYLAPNRGVVRRTLNYLSFVPAAAFRVSRLGRFDLAVGTSPQFFCAVATWLYARVRRVPWVFEVRDLWPESITAVGALRPSLALRLIERLALRMYRDAAAIVCVSEAFIGTLRRRGIDAGKLHFVPNGIEPPFWQSADRDAERARLGVADDELLVCYVGTIGMAHDLGTVLDAASELGRRSARIRLVVVGDGADLQHIQTAASRRRLANVIFTGLVPRERVPGILAAADLALVTLRPSEVFKTVLPSKMFEAMAARKPIVLAVDGEARATLERAGAGIAVPPGDSAALVNAIEQLGANAQGRARMGAAAATFVEREFSRRVWAEHYLGCLSRLLAARAAAPPGAPHAIGERTRG